MQIDLDALERYSRLIVDGPHDHLPQSFVKAHENTLALIAKVRELQQDREKLLALSRAVMADQTYHDTLAQRVNELEQDAARYRLVRSKVAIIGSAGPAGSAAFQFVNLPRPTYIAADPAIEFDAAIDAARGGKEHG